MKTPREILVKRHRSAEPRLDRLWADSLAPKLRFELSSATAAEPVHQNLLFAAGWKLWRELIWPNRRVWTGLGCAWVLIIVLNVASYEPSPQVAAKAEPPSREELRALIEQRQMLAQMMDPVSGPAGRRKSHPSGPRSERAERISAA
jgi:hypothetical protein